jgi:hypothetical protein
VLGRQVAVLLVLRELVMVAAEVGVVVNMLLVLVEILEATLAVDALAFFTYFVFNWT